MEELPIHWQAYEYNHYEKSPDWFWAVGATAIAFAIISIILGNALLGVLIIVAGFSLTFLAVKRPGLAQFEINKRGMVVNNKLYPFSTLYSFWVEFDHEEKLLIRSRKPLMPLIIIPIDGIDPEAVRDTLVMFLPEEEMHEPMSHKILERLGF